MQINADTWIEQDETAPIAGTLEGFETVEGGVVYSVFVSDANA